MSAIARDRGVDRKKVRKYIDRGLEAPAYGPRKPRETVIDSFAGYLRERVTRYPGLTGSRLFRELEDLGYAGSYTAVTDFLRDVRPRRTAARRRLGYQRFKHRPFGVCQVGSIAKAPTAMMLPGSWGPHGASRSGFRHHS